MSGHRHPDAAAATRSRGQVVDVLRGDDAIRAGTSLLVGARLCAVAADPGVGPSRPPKLLALATQTEAICIDVGATPRLATLFVPHVAFAAADAKRLHRGLKRAHILGPDRWACASLCAQMLAGAEPAASPADRSHAPLGAVPHKFGLALPEATSGVVALCAHARALWHLVQQQSRRLVQLGMRDVSRLEAACIAPVADIEARGMPFDAAAWRRQVQRDEAARTALTTWVQRETARPQLDISDTAALLAALRGVGLRPKSARRHDLQALPPPWGARLAALAGLRQRLRAYGSAFLQHVAADGRIHATFAQIGASTGRMACHNPNLQGMTQAGGRKACFVAAAGRRLVVADYRACELRILAQLCGEPAFLEAFTRGDDVHAHLAQKLFGSVAASGMLAHQRQVAKAVTFGLIYGMGPQRLAQILTISRPAAEALQSRYFVTFPRVAAYLEAAEVTGLRLGWTQTLAGRRLALPVASCPDDVAMQRRLARNMPIQGTGADILKAALRRLARAGWRDGRDGVVHCVHDAILIECADDDASAAEAKLAHHMVQAAAAWMPHVPMAVDVRVGPSWGTDAATATADAAAMRGSARQP